MRGFYTGCHKGRSKQRTMYEEPMRIQIKASYLRPEGQGNWGDWQSHNLFKNSHLLGYEIGASSLDQSRGKYHEELMRIQNYNMQTVPSAGKRGYPSHSWFKYRAKWQEEKNLFLYILLCCPTEHEHKLTSWEHQEFSGSLPTGPMFSQVLDNLCHELWCFLALHGIHQPLKTNKKNISFFS